jgi:putative transcriptional regulator
MKNKSKILQAVHETAKGLHRAKAISDITMREFNQLCLSPIHELTPQKIKAIREKNHVSQPVFAAILNTSKSTVQKWESGEKKPSGMALKLLNVVESKGIDILR